MTVEFESIVSLEEHREKNNYYVLRTTFYRWYTYLLAVLCGGWIVIYLHGRPPLAEIPWSLIFILVLMAGLWIVPRDLLALRDEKAEGYPHKVNYTLRTYPNNP